MGLFSLLLQILNGLYHRFCTGQVLTGMLENSYMSKQKKFNPPLKLGEVLELEVNNLTHNGEGVGQYQDFTVFIPQSLPGDQVQCEVISVKPAYARGLIRSILQASPERIQSPCPVSERCGGCQWQEFDYRAQLDAKQASLKATFSKMTTLSPETLQALIKPVKGMDKPFEYRNKAQFPFQLIHGDVVGGFFETRSHKVVSLQECLIQHPTINQVYQATLALLKQYQIPIYDEKTNQGFLRHLVVRYGFHSKQLLIGFITLDMPFPHQREIVTSLKKQFPQLVGIVQNINDKPGNTILGQHNRILDGRDYLMDQLGDYQLKISLKAFYQINPEQTVKLYNSAKEMAGLSGKERVLDAYAGTGSIAIWLSNQAQEIVGIEVVTDAVKDGQENSRINGIENLTFVEGKVEKELPKVMRKQTFDCVILDPPRKGCQIEVLKTLAKHQVPTIIYVSCNPTTLARDAKILMQKGYQLKALQPVDMFPHTYHLECVAHFKIEA